MNETNKRKRAVEWDPEGLTGLKACAKSLLLPDFCVFVLVSA